MLHTSLPKMNLNTLSLETANFPLRRDLVWTGFSHECWKKRRKTCSVEIMTVKEKGIWESLLNPFHSNAVILLYVTEHYEYQPSPIVTNQIRYASSSRLEKVKVMQSSRGLITNLFKCQRKQKLCLYWSWQERGNSKRCPPVSTFLILKFYCA